MKRILQATASVLIAAGALVVGVAKETAARPAPQCTKICATFCPDDTYCKDIGCPDGPASCQAKECLAPVYVFPKTFDCPGQP
jgi:hypothetical protein